MAPPSPKQRRENIGERVAEQGGGASTAAVVCGGVDRRWLPAWLSRRERWNREEEQGKQRRRTGEANKKSRGIVSRRRRAGDFGQIHLIKCGTTLLCQIATSSRIWVWACYIVIGQNKFITN